MENKKKEVINLEKNLRKQKLGDIRKPEKCIFVLFGATGFLAWKKIIPALYLLYKNHSIDIPIIACSRRKYNKQDYIRFLLSYYKKYSKKYVKEKTFLLFLKKNLYYLSIDFVNDNFIKLKDYLTNIMKKTKIKNIIFYFAVYAELYPLITKKLSNVKLNKGGGYRRFVFEKPYGYNTKSAVALEKEIKKFLKEEQIFRSDHYLSKRIIKNVDILKKHNPLIKAIWNNKFIDHIQISILEEESVDGRKGYDKVGAIRDIIQNHVLQIIVLVLARKDFKKERADIIRKLKVSDLLIAQYKNYNKEIGKRSKTETYAAVKFKTTSQFFNFPIYVRTGKKCGRKLTQINIIFKGNPANVLSIKIYPDEGFSFLLYVMPPTFTDIKPITLNFCYPCEFGQEFGFDFEYLLYSLMVNDKTWFVNFDDILASWNVIDKAIAKAKTKKLYLYNDNEPKEIEKFIKKDGRDWIEL